MTVVPIHPTLDVENDAMVGALVTSSVRLGHSSATYVITMTASVDNNMLVMTGFSVQPSA
jgi:hypothetical protein